MGWRAVGPTVAPVPRGGVRPRGAGRVPLRSAKAPSGTGGGGARRPRGEAGGSGGWGPAGPAAVRGFVPGGRREGKALLAGRPAGKGRAGACEG